LKRHADLIKKLKSTLANAESIIKAKDEALSRIGEYCAGSDLNKAWDAAAVALSLRMDGKEKK
jgi:hypothetical protein